MSKKQKAIISIAMGIPSIIGFIHFAGIGAALCLLIMMWANNINIDYE